MAQYIRQNFNNDISEREIKHKEIAYRIACESIVLLENNGVLPIKPGKVALFGTGAKWTIKGGTGSGDVNERHSVSIYEGLLDAGFEITSEDWLSQYDALHDKTIKDASDNFMNSVKHAKFGDIMGMFMGTVAYPSMKIIKSDIAKAPSDTAIYVVSRQAGEGADRHIEKGENDLTDFEIESLQRLVESYKNVILVINVGCSINMNFLSKVPGLGAVIYMCQQGTEGGHAFADIITGKANPSGKLSDTWAVNYEDIPFSNEYSYLNGDLKEEYYKEGLLVGYRYFDAYDVKPQYPFGYGLSYTTFGFKTTNAVVEKTVVTIDIEVTNTGDVAGKEVVQVYLSAPNGELKKEHKSLVAFKKTGVINPGETEKFKISFDLCDCASYQELGARYILDKGAYIVKVGNSSRNTFNSFVLDLDELVVVEQAKNISPIIHEFSELDIPERGEEDLSKLSHLEVKASDFETIIHDYSAPKPYHDPEVDAIVDKMSLFEKATVCVGAGMLAGNRVTKIEGAVGHSTSKLFKKYGLHSVEFSDGPAGLRLTRFAGVYDNGKVKMIDSPLAGLDLLPENIKKLFYADRSKCKTAYQYTTAFPVEVALAQTWNMDLLYEMGEAIAVEMQEFGITYWLAPALNIHRNPLCGRNFEYYSEDPLLTGKCAAAVISGVQSIPGLYVAAKHFCCNNQEDNRMFVNSNVKERTLREIYLRGFKIAVKEGNASGIMTSYNKVNGVNPPNSYDLCTTFLRNECGFTGVVMTDWFGDAFSGSPILAMHAGNDISMPGLPTQNLQILLGTKLSFINEVDVDRCCRNIVKQIVHSDTVSQIRSDKFTKI
ncbi:MAG: glycoside hydrolase family 3 C-terminal domain-containing protein [Clostridia bacterium]|nr:glycoside hydrolase family 3 C-terminal domain-containing protein [Clostridia bacterium]